MQFCVQFYGTCTLLEYFNFMPIYITIYLTTFQREILYFLIHYFIPPLFDSYID